MYAQSDWLSQLKVRIRMFITRNQLCACVRADICWAQLVLFAKLLPSASGLQIRSLLLVD